MQALRERLEIGDVLGKGLDLRIGMEALPIGKAQRHALIVVENRYAHHVKTPPARWLLRIVALAWRRRKISAGFRHRARLPILAAKTPWRGDGESARRDSGGGARASGGGAA